MPSSSVGVDTDPPLKDVARNLRKAEPKLAKEFAKVNQKGADRIAKTGQSLAHADGGVEAHAADAIKASRSAGAVKVVVSSRGAHPEALGAFLGAKAYPQFPDWVGVGWVPGGEGGPYALNPAIRQELPGMLTDYGHAVEEFWAESFSETGGI